MWIPPLPSRFAERLKSAPRLAWAHGYALFASSVGILGWVCMKGGDWGWLRVWAVPLWVHIELETLAFFLIPGPARRTRNTLGHRYRLWRVVALYTTAVVIFECWTGPPMLIFGAGNIWPWNLDWPVAEGEIAVSLLYNAWWLSLGVIALPRSRSRRWFRLLIPLDIDL
jgi:hypothetical protein